MQNPFNFPYYWPVYSPYSTLAPSNMIPLQQLPNNSVAAPDQPPQNHQNNRPQPQIAQVQLRGPAVAHEGAHRQYDAPDDSNRPGKRTKRIKTQKLELQNRNTLPNTVNVILSFIRRRNRSHQLVNKVAGEQTEEILGLFYSYQRYLKDNYVDYTTRDAINALKDRAHAACQLFSKEQQLLLNKLFRMVVRAYLNEQFLLRSLAEHKIHGNNRRDHLRVRRYLMRTIQGAIPQAPPKEGGRYRLRNK